MISEESLQTEVMPDENSDFYHKNKYYQYCFKL